VPARGQGEEHQRLDIAQAAKTVLEECRMVLPGIQAIFGFQLTTVFQQAFGEKLGKGQQLLHIAAMTLVALAVTLVMTPAAYHRHHGGRDVTDTFIKVSSLLLLVGMVVLASGLCLDVFVIARLVFESTAAGATLALGMLVVMLFFWLGFTRLGGLHRAIARTLG